ncbi:YwbE family protein [Lutibacter maritimus]|uniref:YwbE family protein n=1 Tax=Lutibacter maritimus TaxID=593133 RepID=A0A1I6PHQ2_9FLAO|nr:YwbE family protein [Lutibacter maritimus]SFS39742.1 conserved hypothetical protein [Lutibacter maritimus]
MENKKLQGSQRKNIQIGSEVEIVQKNHQRTGKLTEGIVQRILTNSVSHPHGIKVQLKTGEVGRVKWVIL